ncbi:MAG: CmcJ/NvfI family oxidoreductase [Myxococcota bacterium]
MEAETSRKARADTERECKVDGDARVRGHVNYHLRGPDSQRIIIDADGVPGHRIDPELQPAEVSLEDARRLELTLSADGLAFVETPSAVDSFADLEAIRDAYDAELRALLLRETGAVEVEVFDHTLRIDDAGVRPPARHVHNDYTAASARRRLSDILGEERADVWARGPYAIVNVWRPVEHPVERAPLAFALPSSVDAGDWMDIEIVRPHRLAQITGLAHSPQHRWVYWPAMTPSDVAIFRVFDSQGRMPVAHSAVDLAKTPLDARPRKSIESRTMLRFAGPVDDD